MYVKSARLASATAPPARTAPPAPAQPPYVAAEAAAAPVSAHVPAHNGEGGHEQFLYVH